MRRGAQLSDCGRYRYTLWRWWENTGKVCRFIMLNPSTADASEDDPTIRRCIDFAKREGCGSVLVVNLFAFRATSPEDMMKADDPVGPDNSSAIAWALGDSGPAPDGPFIAAWGARGTFGGAGEAMKKRLAGRGLCFGLTANKQPKHPLYIRADQPLQPLT